MIAYDPYASAEKAAALGVTIVSFEEALSRGDFFSLHMPLTPNTKGMFGDDAFAKVRGVPAVCLLGMPRLRTRPARPATSTCSAAPCAIDLPPVSLLYNNVMPTLSASASSSRPCSLALCLSTDEEGRTDC